MQDLVEKFAEKMVSQGLAREGLPVIGAMDDRLYWTRTSGVNEILQGLFHRLNINSIVYCEPAEPYSSVIRYLYEKHMGKQKRGSLKPRDTETRLFLHEIPLLKDLDIDELALSLGTRKSAIIGGKAIAATGRVTPEQAFVVFSSVCFASSVKLISDALSAARKGILDPDLKEIVGSLASRYTSLEEDARSMLQGPLDSEDDVLKAMLVAGRAVVGAGLVDSYFGNISYRLDDVLYISQTGSSLDELEGCIDPCPLDGSSSSAITASSELPAHMKVVLDKGPGTAILHGHPKFSVALSMDCDDEDCAFRDRCHTHCPRKRDFAGHPIVPGEVGAGRFGLHKTLPPALKEHDAAVVFGHGVFSVSKNDFKGAFDALVSTEQDAVAMVMDRLSD